MDHYKKERSSRQHLRIDLDSSLSQEEGGGLLLSNPMACSPGVITPTSSLAPAPAPGGSIHNVNNGGITATASSSTATATATAASHPHSSHSTHHHHHHHYHPASSSSSSSTSQILRTSPPSAGNNNNSLTQSLNYGSHTPTQHGGLSSLSSVGPGTSGSLTRGSERSSFGKGGGGGGGKNRSKSPALLRFFVRGGSAGSRKTSEVEEEDYGSSGSDHEDPFSPRSVTGVIGENSRHTSDPLKSPSTSVEQYATLPRQFRRYHSTGSTYIVTQRDSGFSSERESISHMKDDLGMTQIVEDCHGSPMLVEDYHPAGMEALEVLHNQLQILVKQECDNEETDATNVYEQVIASLSKQIEELSLSMESLRQSDQNLSLSLRMAEQRALEAETKLRHALDRNQRSEQKYLKLAIKYQALAKKHREMEKVHQRRLTHKTSKDWSSPRMPPQRVHSHNQYDRENSASLDAAKRPSTAQGFHSDSSNSSQQQQQQSTSSKTKVVSLSHTQTSV